MSVLGRIQQAFDLKLTRNGPLPEDASLAPDVWAEALQEMVRQKRYREVHDNGDRLWIQAEHRLWLDFSLPTGAIRVEPKPPGPLAKPAAECTECQRFLS